MAKGYQLQSDTAGTDGQPSLLATISGIDLKTVGATTLLTVPAGKTLIVMDILVQVTAISVPIAAPTVRAGINPAYTEWLGATALTNLNALGKTMSLGTTALGLGQEAFSAGAVVALDITVGAIGTTLTGKAFLIGILI